MAPLDMRGPVDSRRLLALPPGHPGWSATRTTTGTRPPPQLPPTMLKCLRCDVTFRWGR